MTLVIAEKPLVAGEIAKVLGAAKRETGYYSGNGYYVSWCVGHLVELAEPDDYDPALKKWSLEALPILPKPFKTVVSTNTKQQFDVLKELCKKSEVTELVCATDAGREGELIYRLVYEKIGCKKPSKRLWISSMESSAIRAGFENLKEQSAYDNLYYAARCRQKADWLVGMNFSRLYTRLYNASLDVGRVRIPTVNLIVERHKDIESFNPRNYYSIVADMGSFKAYLQVDSTAEADSLVERCKTAKAEVTELKQKEKTEYPEALYDLTSLQRDANRLLGYSAQQTLSVVQSLYEAKLTTYPRTDSRYITKDMADSTKNLIGKLIDSGILKTNVADVYDKSCVDVSRVVNDSKVTDHHAIIPTSSISLEKVASLPTVERSILTLIVYRLLSALYKPFQYLATSLTLDIAGAIFTANGREIKDTGFTEITAKLKSELTEVSTEEKEPDTESVGILPPLAQGDSLDVKNVTALPKKSPPPKPYTDDTLLHAMESAGRTLDDESLKEAIQGCGLGTPATRASIIEIVINSGYIERRGKQLLPSAKAISFMGIVEEQLKSAKLTAEWEKRLEDISKGKATENAFMDDIEKFISSVIQTNKQGAHPDKMGAFSSEKPAIGTCPRCGKSVVETQKSFSCVTGQYGCGFVIWKTIASKNLSIDQADKLLKDGKTELITGFTAKSGKTFDAYLVLDDSKNVVFEFEKK